MPSHFSAVTRRQALGAIALGTSSITALAAEPFPSRSIRIIVPFGPGSSTDLIARTVGDRLAEQVRQSVVIENRPGAGGVIGCQAIARSVPDGYTIGIASLATHAMVPATMSQAPYDAVKDFSPLTSLVSVDLLMASSAKVPANNLREFVAWAKAQPKPIFLGTFGAGTSGHFAGFMFAKAAGLTFEPIHYKTPGEAITGLITGDVQLVFAAPSVVPAQVRAGQVRAIALNGPSRAALYPDAPTFGEAGYPSMAFQNWIGLVAPAGVPANVLDYLNAEVTKAALFPTARAKLEQAGFRMIANKREEFISQLANDVVQWREMVRATNFRV